MKEELLLQRVLDRMKETLNEVHCQKAYASGGGWQSIRQTNITLELLQESKEKVVALQVDFFLPIQGAMEKAEALFLAICKIVEAEGMVVAKIARGAILSDNDLGLMMVPATITIKNQEKAKSKVAFTINGTKYAAEKIHTAVTRKQTEYVSFGETEPFETTDEKMVHTVTLKGFSGEQVANLKDFTFAVEDDSNIAYFNCVWSKYSLTENEFTLVSYDRREM